MFFVFIFFIVVLAAPYCCTRTGFLICCHVLYLISVRLLFFSSMLANCGCVCDAVVGFEMSLSINDRNNRVLLYTILGHESFKKQLAFVLIDILLLWSCVSTDF